MENNEKQLMRATPEWMSEKYEEMNTWLFDGELGPCKFGIFTTGKGMEGGTLGKFVMDNPKVMVDKRKRKLILWTGSWYTSEYITQETFVDICNPTIKLNGHYSGTEESLLDTLVHEMVHYYQYMFGACPPKAHGPEFKRIAAWVSGKSGGRFTVQRLASAEVMQGYQLDSDMQQRRDNRAANKKAKALEVFVYLTNGEIQLTQTTSKKLVNDIVTFWENQRLYRASRQAKEILYSDDPEMVNFVMSNGYKKAMRSHRFWRIQDLPMSAFVKQYPYRVIWKNDNTNENKMRDIKTIVESVVEDYVSNIEAGEDLIPISGMDLGAESPLETIA